MLTTERPWQHGPTELIAFALTRLQSNADFDQRLAFLLLDIGVETIFKTFLTLPEKVTKTKVPYGDRQKAASGNFHDLVNGLEKAAGDRLKGVDLAAIEFYHELRNKLYHQGNGITIPTYNSKAYAKIAVELLRLLLEVDLREELPKSPGVARRSYQVGDFADVADVWGDRCWFALNEPAVVVKMITASDDGIPAAEAVGQDLRRRFGDELRQPPVRRFIGFLIRQVMESHHYQPVENIPTKDKTLFETASVYRRRND